MLAETNPIVLAITMVVTLLHSVFNFLAFKNDISFWKDKKRSVSQNQFLDGIVFCVVSRVFSCFFRVFFFVIVCFFHIFVFFVCLRIYVFVVRGMGLRITVISQTIVYTRQLFSNTMRPPFFRPVLVLLRYVWGVVQVVGRHFCPVDACEFVLPGGDFPVPRG